MACILTLKATESIKAHLLPAMVWCVFAPGSPCPDVCPGPSFACPAGPVAARPHRHSGLLLHPAARTGKPLHIFPPCWFSIHSNLAVPGTSVCVSAQPGIPTRSESPERAALSHTEQLSLSSGLQQCRAAHSLCFELHCLTLPHRASKILEKFHLKFKTA